jgi:hypothetical protein
MRNRQLLWIPLFLLLLAPAAAQALTEEKTGTVYPDQIVVEYGDEVFPLVATGTALREKTMLKVDIYTIVSYITEGFELGEDPARSIWKAEVFKRLQLDLRRGFSKEKLIHSFEEVIEKNYSEEQRAGFADAMATFNAYWFRDAEDGDEIIFDYDPDSGLHTWLNGEEVGVIEDPVFAQALWSVWFGDEPASKDMRKRLSGQD